MTAAGLGILTLNVGNPSRERAARQLAWLDSREEHVLVLTETCDSKGTALLGERLAHAGWLVESPVPANGDRGVLVASRVRLVSGETRVAQPLGARAVQVAVAGGPDVIGVYVPSRDTSETKTDRKRRFVAAFSDALSARRGGAAILVGDLNIVEPLHRPRRREFLDWEFGLYEDLASGGQWADAYRVVQPEAMDYSWVGRDDDGYRFDHAFVTRDLVSAVAGCSYVHETRDLGLSDHSALSLSITAGSTELLDGIGSISRDPAALF